MPQPSGDEVIDRPDILEMEEMDVSSAEESEIESDEDDRSVSSTRKIFTSELLQIHVTSGKVF